MSPIAPKRTQWRPGVLAPSLIACLLTLAFTVLAAGSVRAEDKLPPTSVSAPLPAPVVEYKIAPLDHLTVSVFQVPDLTGDVAVDGAGQISLPLIGSEAAAGKTASELSRDIADKLRAKYLQDPQVTVVVKDATGQRITVDGAVQQPGVYPISGRTTLIQVISMARGPDTTRANEKKIVIFRDVNGKKTTLTYNLAAIRDGKAPDPEVYGNDIVVVFSSTMRATFHDLIQASPLIALMRFY